MARLVIGLNDLATVNPDLASEWNFEKNGMLKPTDLTPNSQKTVWWICASGHQWKSPINKRAIRNDGCPYCSNHRLLAGFNDLATVRPELATEWSYERNGDLNPSDVKYNSRTKVWWICKKGHEWEAAVSARAVRGIGCPYCSHRHVRSRNEFIADLHQVNPSISLMGEYKNTNFKTLFRCRNCGNEWTAKPTNLLRGGGCPRCAKTGTSRMEQFICVFLETLLGENEVLSRDRRSIGMELDIVYGSYAWEPGSWAWHGSGAKIENDREKRRRCREKGIELFTIYDGCKGEIPADVLQDCVCFDFDLWSEPEHKTLKRLCDDWAKRLGKKINPLTFDWAPIEFEAVKRCRAMSQEEFVSKLKIASSSSISLNSKFVCLTEKVTVQCKICGTIWRTQPFSLLGGHGCPKCAHKNAIENRTGKTALKTNDDFLEELRIRNSHYASREFEITSGYTGCDRPLSCICLVCGNTWNTTPSQLLGHNSGCPTCGHKAGGRKLSIVKRMNPEIFAKRMEALHPNLSLLEPCRNAKTKIEVKCNIDGYVWHILPASLSSGSGCPVCSNNVVMAGVNDLSTTNPIISSEWNFDKNAGLCPSDVMAGSGKKVWWLCPYCGHEWRQQIAERHRNKYLCPKCHTAK